MSSESARRTHPLLRGIVASALTAAALSLVILPALRSDAATPEYQITVTPATGLADGQAFTVRVAGPPGMTVLNSGFCDPAMPQPTSQDDLTEWCTDTVGNGTPGGLAPADPDGVAELTVRAGAGAATKTSPALGTTHSWTCDTTSACKLPLVIHFPGTASAFDVSTLLTYRTDDLTSSCLGTRADEVGSSAPDRLTEQWAAWTVDHCGGQPKATSASFENDGRADTEFTDGAVDLAYSAVPPGTPGFAPATRPAVATPVALNATVIAAAGYYPSTSSVPGVKLWRRVDHVDMSYQEAAALLSGHLSLDEELQGSLIARNPEFAVQSGAIGFTSPGGLAGAQATTQVASSFFAATQAGGWTYPNSKSKYEDHAGQPLGAFGDYNAVFNSLAMVDLATGKPQIVGDMYRKLAEKPESVSLVTFYLTDLATARQLGLAPVALGDGRGPFVAPTAGTLQAAVPALKADASGFRLPHAGDSAAEAYPLTFVEYALTPSEQLLDESCRPKTGELAAIKDWLGYVTGAGQAPATLAASGVAPLTADLADEATASLAKIGAAAPTTGPCAPVTTTTTAAPPSTPTDTIPDAPNGGGAGTLPLGDLATGSLGGNDLTAGSTSLGATRTPGRHSVAQADEVATATHIPRFANPLGSPLAAGMVALPGLIGLASANGWLSTGRPFPKRLRPPGPK
ncbi:hypothetical protein [Aquihabitans sp. McL0605]|uniref:hypothetical protein n=1 Tax=Aquihabitans sp. McL0605 TaxID=3415671 RepID=UPI003CEF8F86